MSSGLSRSGDCAPLATEGAGPGAGACPLLTQLSSPPGWRAGGGGGGGSGISPKPETPGWVRLASKATSRSKMNSAKPAFSFHCFVAWRAIRISIKSEPPFLSKFTPATALYNISDTCFVVQLDLHALIHPVHPCIPVGQVDLML